MILNNLIKATTWFLGPGTQYKQLNYHGFKLDVGLYVTNSLHQKSQVSERSNRERNILLTD